MSNSIYRVPPAVNEPISSFAPGTVERAALQTKLKEMSANTVDIPSSSMVKKFVQEIQLTV